MRLPSSLSPADQQRVTRLAKELSLYARLTEGAAPARQALQPGTPGFTQTARRDYADLVSLYGAARLPPSFLVASPPAAVQAAVDAFEAAHGGRPEVALNAIDGHRTYQVQVAQRAQTQVLLVDARGRELGRGVVRGSTVAWR